MTFRHPRSFICLSILGYCASPTSAAILYSDNFNVDSSAAWTVNIAPRLRLRFQLSKTPCLLTTIPRWGFRLHRVPATRLVFGFAQNVPGTAAAPVTTRPTQTLSGLSVSPTGQNFGTNYSVKFYAWSNFNGSANASGLADNANSQGGTNNVLMAIGTAGTVPLVVGGNTGLAASPAAMDGIGFATTGDGGITNDYRMYPASGTITPAGANYAAGSNANTALYYQGLFGTHTAPAAQLAISTAEFNDGEFNTQAGSTQAGAFGFAWHKVLLTKLNNVVYWDIDDARIARIDVGAITLGGSNLALGQSDVNNTTTRHPILLFTVFDNLVVSEAPEPTSIFLLFTGLMLPGFSARQRGKCNG